MFTCIYIFCNFKQIYIVKSIYIYIVIVDVVVIVIIFGGVLSSIQELR